MATINEIKQQAEAVKNATQVGENTAERVGGALAGLADIAKQQDSKLNDLADKSKELEDNIEGKAEKSEVDTELAKKFDKENIAQEFGDSEDKVVSQFALPFREIESPEFIKAIVDAEDHFLFGIQLDGSIEWGKGIPAPIRAKLQEIINQCQQDKTDILEAINAAKKELSASITALQEGKVDKEEGKSLIEDEVKECFRVIENEEFIMAVVDSEDRLLFGFYRATGKPYYPLNEMYHVIQNEEYFALWLDSADHVLLGIRRDNGEIIGEIHAVNALKQVISQLQSDVAALQEKVGTIDTNLKELLDVFSLQDNEEYLSVETDAEGKVIGYIASDGSHYLYKVKSETIPTEFEHIEDLENRIEMTIDAEGKVLGYRKSNGTRYEKSLDVQSLKISGSSIENVINESIEKIQLSNINGVEDFGKENLYTGYTKRYTTADGKQTFISPNESIGGVFCNPIRCSAGDYFTRTGIATAIIVVSDKNDNNAQRLYQADGSLPGNTFQIPNGWDWAYYVRCVCMSTDTELAIMRGKYAVKKSDQDGKLRIPNMKLSAANFTKETKFISSPNGSMYEIAVNNNGELYAKPVDKDIVFAGDIPSNLTYSLINNLSDSESIPFDRFVCAIGSYATVFKGTGLTSYKDFSPLAMNSNIEHHYNSANEGRYVVLISVGNKRGLYVYDDDWKLIDCLIQDIDQHDFIYIDDFHYIVFKNTHVECEKDGETVTLSLPCIYEYKNGKVIASRLLNDKIITDDIYMFSFEQGTHLNTMRFDGDDQTKIILNARHNMSFYILERKVSNDGAVTFGNILYQVGGLHSAKNYDIESRIKTPDECQWFLCHDVKRWGNKEINGISYPVYTLFDNNTKWNINPRNGGNGTDKNVNSRIVQMAIDFANKKIVEYKCYYIEGYYSDIMSSAIMFNEGVLFVDYARKPMAGLYDYTTEVTEHVGNTYKNAKKLLEFYSGTQTPYRVNTFNLK